MSSGSFISSKYESNASNIYGCRVQPETVALVLNAVTNDPPAGAVNQEVSARMTGSRRQFGVTARKVTLRFTGTVPDGYSGDPVECPIMQNSVFNGITVLQTGTYLGAPVEVISKTSEQVR